MKPVGFPMLVVRLDRSKKEIRGQRSEVRGQKSEVRVRVRGQKSEVRGQGSGVRGQKSAVYAPTSDIRPLTSASSCRYMLRYHRRLVHPLRLQPLQRLPVFGRHHLDELT